YLLDTILHGSGKSLKDFPPMPLPVENWAQLDENRLIAEQLAYNREEQRDLAQPRIAGLNAEQ
ncbi:hypothetical protein C8R45DRAFT_789696, partial [Mycena sanguinolenta]